LRLERNVKIRFFDKRTYHVLSAILNLTQIIMETLDHAERMQFLTNTIPDSESYD